MFISMSQGERESVILLLFYNLAKLKINFDPFS